MIILKKGESANPLWGIETEYITDEQIEALKSGSRKWQQIVAVG